ncbi:hypothetical protein Tco_0790172 [Tanacetum coccineum]
MFKFPSSVPISVTDSGLFFEESDTFLSYSDNSLLEFETFSDHTEETRSGRGLTSVVISDNSNDLLLEFPKFESFHFDLDPLFPRPPPEPTDVEISLIIEPDAPVINDFDKLNEDECFDLEGGEMGNRGCEATCVSSSGIGVDEFTLSSLEVLLILATFDGLDVGLLEDFIGEDDYDDDDCDEEMSLVRMLVDGF